MDGYLPAKFIQPDAEDESEYWRKAIFNEFKWKVALDFTLVELKAIYKAGSQILSCVNGVTRGKGSGWMHKYLGGASFLHGEFPGTQHSFVTGSRVHITPAWQGRNWTHIVHELGHVYDDNTGGFFWAAVFGGGNADRLQKAIGGHPAGIRFLNGTRGVPMNYRWPEGCYGNVATAEYFAEVFMYAIYNRSQVPGPPGVVVDALQRFIAAEAANLP